MYTTKQTRSMSGFVAKSTYVLLYEQLVLLFFEY
jgi:hypothetical protein